MSNSKIKDKWLRQKMESDGLNPHKYDEMPKNKPSKYITMHCSSDSIRHLQEPSSFGGHSIPKGGHRMVSGLVRASIKEEVRKEIEDELQNFLEENNTF